VSDPKLDAVQACVAGALRRQAGKYVASLDPSVLQQILDNARDGQAANVQLAVSVDPADLAARADAASPALRVGKSTLVGSPFLCDVYLAGPAGEWRAEAAVRFDEWVVCDPAKDLRKLSESVGPEDRVLYEVPKGIEARAVLYFAGSECDTDAVGGLLTTVWFHGMSAVVVLGECAQREVLLAVCRLAGAHVFDSLDDAMGEVERILREGPEPSTHLLVAEDMKPVGDENETTLKLPSGNHLVVKYFGADHQADRVMIHSRSAGHADAPPNLDLIVPDPDRETEDTIPGPDGREVHPVETHRVQVRHHGPTDAGRSVIPPGFLPPPTG